MRHWGHRKRRYSSWAMGHGGYRSERSGGSPLPDVETRCEYELS